MNWKAKHNSIIVLRRKLSPVNVSIHDQMTGLFFLFQKRNAVNFVQNQVDSSPFFMFLSTPACHEPDTPAPQYKDEYSDMKAPRTASYNKPGGKVRASYWGGTRNLTTNKIK